MGANRTGQTVQTATISPEDNRDVGDTPTANPRPSTINTSNATGPAASSKTTEQSIANNATQIVNLAGNIIKKTVDAEQRILRKDKSYPLYEYKTTKKDSEKEHRFVKLFTTNQYRKLYDKIDENSVYGSESVSQTKPRGGENNLKLNNLTLRYVDGMWKVEDSSGSGPAEGPATKTGDGGKEAINADRSATKTGDKDAERAKLDKQAKLDKSIAAETAAANTSTETESETDLERTMREARAATGEARKSTKEAEHELQKLEDAMR